MKAKVTDLNIISRQYVNSLVRQPYENKALSVLYAVAARVRVGPGWVTAQGAGYKGASHPPPLSPLAH